jgi:4-hydroxy-tetrahydrodipicolinate reductase
MNIALLGYGRMGKTIEALALKRGHSIVIKTSDITTVDITKADVAIDFSIPEAAFKNITTCFNQNIPVISGTTGWLKDFDKAVDLCKTEKGAFIYASNFSLGVNLFFELNSKLAQMMSKFNDYKVDVEEIHHTQKLDTPSGTAITLAEDIISQSTKLKHWSLEERNSEALKIEAKRIENVPGTHIVTYKSDIDTISIEHEAHNRDGFALGAIIAAEWLIGKQGVFTMKDVLNLS